MDDRRRFEEAYRVHSAAVVAYAARRTDPLTAADVTSETFVVAWRRVSDLPDPEGQRAWLITIARNVLANAHRSERRRLRLVRKVSSEVERTVREVMMNRGPADTTSDQGGLEDALLAALEDLDADDRELLTLLAWDGLTRSEICQVLDCSNEALRTRIHRARIRFRTALDRRRPGSDEPRPQGVLSDRPPTTPMAGDAVRTAGDAARAVVDAAPAVGDTPLTTRSMRNV